jgi:hypothetical protein
VLPDLAELKTALGLWARGLLVRAPKNGVVVTLAKTLARIAWAVLTRGRAYVAAGEATAA